MSIFLESTLLSRSSVLTNVDINQVNSLIDASKANVERLVGQIDELSCMLEKERAILVKLRALVAPVRKLPTELLVEIFKHAVHTPLLDDTPFSLHHLPQIRDMFKPDAHTALPIVLRLSQVTACWRQVLHAMPQFWAEGVIAVDLSRPNDSNNIYFLSGLEDLLARSSPFPISVSLTQSYNPNMSFAGSITLARGMLNTAHRWRNLTLELSPFQVSHFNALAPGTFEALERLHIRTKAHHKEPVTAFQSCPRLRHFTLHRSHYSPSELHFFQMPWSQLTHLQISDRSVGGCRAILLQCRNLISAQFLTSYTSYYWDFGQAAMMQPPVVVLHFLKMLTITFSGGSDVDGPGGFEAFFLPLALPSLQTLELGFDPDVLDGFWPTNTFSQFQTRSPNIEQISLFNSDTDSEGLLALLRHAPALTTLRINHSWACIDDEVLGALRYDSGDFLPLAPKLQEISFISVGHDFDEGLFEAVIRSRWWTDELVLPAAFPPRVARLKEVVFDMASDELKTRMKELAEQGLALEL
ncbi:hypothetical protein DFH09DRAFT_1188523 [Mycena vulgaris]|nr:hypothetical protein DFH09DRAFT_1188523 [Mycena vulgaris]